jgi:hypothetical protein
MEHFFIDNETVRDLRDWYYVKGYAREGSRPLTVMRNYARRHGLAVGVRATDAVVVIERINDKLTQRTLAPGRAAISWGNARLT